MDKLAKQQAKALRAKYVRKGWFKNNRSEGCPLIAAARLKGLPLQVREKMCLKCIFPACVESSFK